MLVFTLVISQRCNSNNYVTSLIDINLPTIDLGPVHTNHDSFETTYLRTPICVDRALNHSGDWFKEGACLKHEIVK